MTRVIVKKGDIFFAKVGENKNKFFQYVADDERQLDSNVIRVYKKTYEEDQTPGLTEIIKDDIEFYAHGLIKLGIQFGHWTKAGNIKEVGEINVIFRDTYDFGRSEGGEPIVISKKWVVWKINDPEFTRVSELVGENRNAEIGLVMNPKSIVYRMQTGHYDLVNYPKFE